MDIEAQTGEMLQVPLSLLVPSELNVRRQGGENVDELVALIRSQGLLQNLIVVHHLGKRGAATKKYGVVGGGRRLRALKALEAEGHFTAGTEFPCKLISREVAMLASAAENSGREPMHPADEFEAFRRMVDAGSSVEDVAAAFGIEPLAVRRRLKLAAVSPSFITLYRDGRIKLDQLMALAASDDHAQQERVWTGAKEWERDARRLRQLMTADELPVQGSAVVKFVTLKAYAKAGGTVREDLFAADGEDGRYVTDVPLLHELAQAKLEDITGPVRAEGWGWVEARVKCSYSDLHGFDRAVKGRRAPAEHEQADLERLGAETAAITRQLDALYDEEGDEDKAEALEQQLHAVESQQEALHDALAVWTPEIMACAGALVTIGESGKAVMHRGLVKPEDRKEAKRATAAGTTTESGEADAAEPDRPTHSEALMRRLTAHRTVALQAMLIDNAHVALAALTQTLVLQVLGDRLGCGATALEIRAVSSEHKVVGLADDMETARAWTELKSRAERWRARLPVDLKGLLAWLLALPRDELLELLTLCSALTVDAIASRDRAHPVDELALAAGLNMADWWEASGGGYLNHVPKVRIAEALSEGVSTETAHQVAKLKKGEAVVLAERLLAGRRWLPVPLRAKSSV